MKRSGRPLRMSGEYRHCCVAATAARWGAPPAPPIEAPALRRPCPRHGRSPRGSRRLRMRLLRQGGRQISRLDAGAASSGTLDICSNTEPVLAGPAMSSSSEAAAQDQELHLPHTCIDAAWHAAFSTPAGHLRRRQRSQQRVGRDAGPQLDRRRRTGPASAGPRPVVRPPWAPTHSRRRGRRIAGRRRRNGQRRRRSRKNSGSCAVGWRYRSRGGTTARRTSACAVSEITISVPWYSGICTNLAVTRMEHRVLPCSRAFCSMAAAPMHAGSHSYVRARVPARISPRPSKIFAPGARGTGAIFLFEKSRRALAS